MSFPLRVPRLTTVTVAAALLAGASPAAPLELGVPPGTYGPKIVTPPEARKAQDPPPEKSKDDAHDDDKTTELDGVTVTGKRNPAKRLPTLGTSRPRKRDMIDKLNDWYQKHPKDPNQLDDAQKAFLEHATKSTDANPTQNIQYGTPPSREPEDYGDPIEAAQKNLKKKP